MAVRRRFRFLRALLRPTPIFGLAIIAVLWLGLGYLLNVERTNTLEAAVQRGASLARVFEENAIRLFKGVDGTLLLLRLAYEENPQQFNLRHWAERTAFLGELTIQVGLIGPDGYMKASTADYSGGRLDLSDREHFRAHLNTAADVLYISRPVVGRVSGKVSLQLTRKLRQADGSFGGVIVASLDPGFGERFYQSLDVGAQGGITLRGLDGAIRASYGAAVPNVDQTNMPGALSQALARAPQGHYWAGDAVDGRDGLISYGIVGGYPLLIPLVLAEE